MACNGGNGVVIALVAIMRKLLILAHALVEQNRMCDHKQP